MSELEPTRQGEGGDGKTEDDWTAVSKPPPRRLAPQHTLSKADLGADSPRNKAALEISKKRVARFTKDELLAMRKPNSKILQSMSDMGEIISEKAMDPVCWEPFDQDEVIRLWQASLQQNRRVPPGGLATGGSGKGLHRGRDGDDDSNQWRGSNRVEKSLWDDLPNSGGGAAGGVFELSDFAAAAQKFRFDTKDMGLGDLDTPGDQEEDALERLLREQADLDAAEHEVEETSDVPEWAEDELGLGLGMSLGSETLSGAVELTKPSAESEVKRSLLLGALNLRSSSLPVPSAPQTQQLFQHDYLLQQQHMSQYHHQIALTDEWWYTDPSGNEQGPFDTANMCAWSLGGYFANDLPIKLKHWTAFHPLCTVFLSQDSAFKDLPQEPSSLLSANLLQSERMVVEQQRQQQLLQQQQQQQQQLVAEQQRQQQVQQMVAEQQRQQQLQQMVADQQRQQQQQLEQQQQQQEQQQQQHLQQQRLLQQNAEHQRLQMQQAHLLQQQLSVPSQEGVSLAAMQQEADVLVSLQQHQSLHKGPAPWSSSTLPAAPFSTFQDIQRDETNCKASADSSSATQLKSVLGMKSNTHEPKMGWAGASPGAIGKVAVKPLKEIMQQEILINSFPEISRPATNSWAAKIGTGSVSASTPGSSSSGTSSLQPSRTPNNLQQPTSSRQQPQTSAKPVPLPVIHDMAPSMVEWCITTMKGIIGLDFDGTGLLEILVSLESPVDIREIISETLGSTPQSSQFATEFIKKKAGGTRRR